MLFVGCQRLGQDHLCNPAKGAGEEGVEIFAYEGECTVLSKLSFTHHTQPTDIKAPSPSDVQPELYCNGASSNATNTTNPIEQLRGGARVDFVVHIMRKLPKDHRIYLGVIIDEITRSKAFAPAIKKRANMDVSGMAQTGDPLPTSIQLLSSCRHICVYSRGYTLPNGSENFCIAAMSGQLSSSESSSTRVAIRPPPFRSLLTSFFPRHQASPPSSSSPVPTHLYHRFRPLLCALT